MYAHKHHLILWLNIVELNFHSSVDSWNTQIQVHIKIFSKIANYIDNENWFGFVLYPLNYFGECFFNQHGICKVL